MVGAYFGVHRNRRRAGLLLGLFLSWVGVALVFRLKDRSPAARRRRYKDRVNNALDNVEQDIRLRRSGKPAKVPDAGLPRSIARRIDREW